VHRVERRGLRLGWALTKLLIFVYVFGRLTGGSRTCVTRVTQSYLEGAQSRVDLIQIAIVVEAAANRVDDPALFVRSILRLGGLIYVHAGNRSRSPIQLCQLQCGVLRGTLSGRRRVQDGKEMSQCRMIHWSRLENVAGRVQLMTRAARIRPETAATGNL